MTNAKVTPSDSRTSELVSTFYTLKQVKNRTYLYQITIGEDGKPVWKSKGIVSKLDLKDPEIK